MEHNIIGQRMRTLREKVKLSQAKLVAVVGGIKQPVYARYELGEIMPPYTALIKLADYYNVSTDYMLGRMENPHGKYFGEQELSKSEKMNDFIEMCFEPNTKANQKLKEVLKKLMEDSE